MHPRSIRTNDRRGSSRHALAHSRTRSADQIAFDAETERATSPTGAVSWRTWGEFNTHHYRGVWLATTRIMYPWPLRDTWTPFRIVDDDSVSPALAFHSRRECASSRVIPGRETSREISRARVFIFLLSRKIIARVTAYLFKSAATFSPNRRMEIGDEAIAIRKYSCCVSRWILARSLFWSSHLWFYLSFRPFRGESAFSVACRVLPRLFFFLGHYRCSFKHLAF
jgi:hypothetical protein